MLPPSSLTVPDVQISRVRFFMEELCSRRCSEIVRRYQRKRSVTLFVWSARPVLNAASQAAILLGRGPIQFLKNNPIQSSFWVLHDPRQGEMGFALQLSSFPEQPP
jgi:hypothetical protein